LTSHDRISSTHTVANSFAERSIGTLLRELLDRTIIWNQHQLNRLVTDYIDHYNAHRPHRSLAQRPPLNIDPPVTVDRDPIHLQVIRSTRWHGLIHEYKHVA
jgi:putative transposase